MQFLSHTTRAVPSLFLSKEFSRMKRVWDLVDYSARITQRLSSSSSDVECVPWLREIKFNDSTQMFSW